MPRPIAYIEDSGQSWRCDGCGSYGSISAASNGLRYAERHIGLHIDECTPTQETVTMSNGEQDYGAWRAEQQRRAQAHAFKWAERASTEYDQAVRHEDDARERQQYDSGWQRDRTAESRALAQFHGVRSTEALKLAEMWAAIAEALADGQLPLTTTFEVRSEGGDQASLTDSLANPDIVGRFHRG